jgi:hypothetical protein
VLGGFHLSGKAFEPIIQNSVGTRFEFAAAGPEEARP